MNSTFRAILAVLLVGAALLGLGALSRVPYGDTAAGQAVVRLSWRVRGVRVEACRRLGVEELEALPPHMRRPEVCEGRIAPYRLRVRVDGEVVEDGLVQGAGVREDRPLYVFRELRVPPGRHALAVEFHRIAAEAERGRRSAGAEQAGGAREVEEAYDADDAEDADDTGRTRHRRQASPARLDLDVDVTLEPGQVALITYDPERRALVVRGAAGTAGGRGGKRP